MLQHLLIGHIAGRRHYSYSIKTKFHLCYNFTISMQKYYILLTYNHFILYFHCFTHIFTHIILLILYIILFLNTMQTFSSFYKVFGFSMSSSLKIHNLRCFCANKFVKNTPKSHYLPLFWANLLEKSPIINKKTQKNLFVQKFLLPLQQIRKLIITRIKNLITLIPYEIC